MFIVIRLLPAFVGIVTGLSFAYQARHATSYPWAALIGIAVFAIGGFAVAWSRHRHVGDARPLVPGILMAVSAAFGLVLAEGAIAGVLIPLFVGGSAFLMLELLFLSLYAPARYPVNGLSHVNLVLVPVSLWLVTYASLGLVIFVNATRLIPIAALGAVSYAFFAATSHAESNSQARFRWSMIGAWLGIQEGILVVFLPLDLVASSTFVALASAYVLRTRRYGIPPSVPRRQIAAEAMTFLLLLAAILTTARWM
jgi:hypothetical protein